MSHEERWKILEQIKKPNKRNWILIIPNSLGETAAVCGLAKRFIEKHRHGITLVITKSHAFMTECFPNAFDRVVYADLGVMRQFSESGFIPPNSLCVDFPINTWLTQNGDGRTYQIRERWVDTVGRAGLHFLDLYRYVLRLDWRSQFTLAQVPEEAYAKANEIIEYLRILRGKMVVFFALSTKVHYKMDAIFPAQICYYWNKFQFKSMNLMNGRRQFLIPDLACNAKKLRQWIMPVEHNMQVCDEIAHGVAMPTASMSSPCTVDVVAEHEFV